jgi:hypothetical protein
MARLYREVVLVFIWPAARQPKPPQPVSVSAADLAGLRRDLSQGATLAGPTKVTVATRTIDAAGTNDVPEAPPVTLG